MLLQWSLEVCNACLFSCGFLPVCRQTSSLIRCFLSFCLFLCRVPLVPCISFVGNPPFFVYQSTSFQRHELWSHHTRSYSPSSLLCHSPTCSAFDAGFKMFRYEGPTSLFKGLSPALLRQATYGSMRYGFYEPIKSLIMADSKTPAPLWKKVRKGNRGEKLCMHGRNCV